MNQTAGAILKRKVSAIQARGYSFPIQSELGAKLEYAAAKGATSALRVTTEAIVEHSRVGRLSTLIDALPMPGLFVLVEFEGGHIAVIGFDMQLVDHVVDILAGGDPDISRTLPARTPTAIDAALCRQVIGSMLAHFDEEIRALANGVCLGRFRIGRVEHMPMSLQYTLPDHQYLIFRVSLDIGDDARDGGFHFALPLSALEPVEIVLRRSGFLRAQGESENWRRHMRKVVGRTRVGITAVIDRCRMQVAELSRLEVGALFPLTDVTLDDVVLELKAKGEVRPIGRGRLGTYKRNKAVRLIEPPDRTFLEPLAEMLAAEAAAGATGENTGDAGHD
ncbi:MAG: FliM/FliN family flagellar motor switch protein [Paracoccaceae bacterium]